MLAWTITALVTEIDPRFQALQQSNLLKLRLNGNPLGEARNDRNGEFSNRLSVKEFGAVSSWRPLFLYVLLF